MPLATAIAATAMKHARYGNVHPDPHTVLPFVVEHAGGINKEGIQLFMMFRDAADNKLNTRASGLSSWSSNVMHAPGQAGRSKPAHGVMYGLYHMPDLLLG